MMSAVKARRLASCSPIRLGSSQDVPKSRLRPRLANISENRARSEHHTMSAARAMPKPAPTATPSTLAITGLGQSCMAITVSAMSRMRSMRCRGGSSLLACSPSPGPTSAPAQKSPPAPVMTTARAGDSAISRNPWRRAAHMSGVQAFLRRGRSMVTVVTAPADSMWTFGCGNGAPGMLSEWCSDATQPEPRVPPDRDRDSVGRALKRYPAGTASATCTTVAVPSATTRPRPGSGASAKRAGTLAPNRSASRGPGLNSTPVRHDRISCSHWP